MKLTEISIKKPFIALAFWAMIIALGIYGYRNLPVSFSPPDKFVHVSVSVSYPGADNKTVLREITKPLEQKLFQLSGISAVTSVTSNEVSQITIDFEKGVSNAEAISAVFVEVSEAAKQFPQGVHPPIVQTSGPFLTPLFSFAVTSSLSPIDLYDLLHETVQPKIENIEGVSHLEIIGQKERQTTIELNLEKMKQREISAAEVVARLKEMGNNVYIESNIPYLILGQYTDLSEIKDITINFLSNDRSVSLNEIAEIREDFVQPTAYAYYNKEPCLIIDIYGRRNADNLILENAVPKALKKIEKQFSENKLSFSILTNRESNLIDLVKDFYKNIFISIFAALLIIIFVFRDFSSVFVSLSSIPLSLCGCFWILYFGGYSLSIYTILSFIVSIGLIIDDVIIIREAIFRHIESGSKPFEATRKGMAEMTVPILGTTFMILSVALAMIVVQKTNYTQYMEDFGVTLFFCMFFSLLEALTLGPLLCAYLLKVKPKVTEKVNVSEEFAETELYFLKKYPKAICFIAGIILVGGYAVASFVQHEGIPLVETRHIEVQKNFVQSSAEETSSNALAFAQELRENYPELESIGIRAEKDKEIVYLQLPDDSEIKPSLMRKNLENDLQKRIEQNKIHSFEILNTVISHRPYTPDFEMELYGSDINQLNEYSNKLFHELSTSNQLINLTNSSLFIKPQHLLNIDQIKMNFFGVEVDPLANELQILFNGYEVPSLYNPLEEGKKYRDSIRVKTSKLNQESLKHIHVLNINSKLVPINQFASIETFKTLEEIRRKNGKNLITIEGSNNSANPKASPLSFVLEKIKTTLPVPSNVTLSWEGDAKKKLDINTMQFKMILISMIFIYIVLVLLYQSIFQPLVIFFPLPFSFVGSLSALYFTGDTINIFSTIGVIISIGIAAKNGIILIHYANERIAEGMDYEEAIYKAVKIRFRPILMTSIGVFLTTLPIFIPWNPYSKLQFSLGVALMGGLVSSTIVSLIILPLVFRYTYPAYIKISRFTANLFNQE